MRSTWLTAMCFALGEPVSHIIFAVKQTRTFSPVSHKKIKDKNRRPAMDHRDIASARKLSKPAQVANAYVVRRTLIWLSRRRNEKKLTCMHGTWQRARSIIDRAAIALLSLDRRNRRDSMKNISWKLRTYWKSENYRWIEK